MLPNVIKIEKNIPMPTRTYFGRGSRYNFIKDLEVGDSFVINGNTPDYTPKSAMSTVYSMAHAIRKKGKKNLNSNYSDFRVSCRILSGTNRKPLSVRIWRTK